MGWIGCAWVGVAGCGHGSGLWVVGCVGRGPRWDMGKKIWAGVTHEASERASELGVPRQCWPARHLSKFIVIISQQVFVRVAKKVKSSLGRREGPGAQEHSASGSRQPSGAADLILFSRSLPNSRFEIFEWVGCRAASLERGSPRLALSGRRDRPDDERDALSSRQQAHVYYVTSGVGRSCW